MGLRRMMSATIMSLTFLPGPLRPGWAWVGHHFDLREGDCIPRDPS